MAVTKRRNTGRSSSYADTPFRIITAEAAGTDDIVPILVTDEYIELDASLGNIIALLPSATTVRSGKGFWFMRTDTEASTYTTTIATSDGQTINGEGSAIINIQYSSLFVVSNGTNWLLYASPGSFSLSKDVLWVFPNTISNDQNPSLYTYIAATQMSFVAFDLKMNAAPTGNNIIVDWVINGSINPALRMTLSAGDDYVELAIPIVLNVGDTLKPTIPQVGSLQPGQTMALRARGI